MFVFLIGVLVMVWQSWSTMDTFISFRITDAISKETAKTLPPPSVVICQEHNWMNGHFEFLSKYKDGVNFSDEDWVLKQFYQLNDKMNITIISPFYLELDRSISWVFQVLSKTKTFLKSFGPKPKTSQNFKCMSF